MTFRAPRLRTLTAPLLLAACTAHARAPAAPVQGYTIYVANESSDVVSKLAYDREAGLRVLAEIPVGVRPGDIEGAHGLAVSPAGDAWYVTLAHGTPFGELWKFDAATDRLVARTTLGMFPATVGVSPDGHFVFVANFNLHGDATPSSVSVVHAASMSEVARPRTCVMPHGSRVAEGGGAHYSACMHDEQLVELDARSLALRGRISVAPGHEGALPPDADSGVAHADRGAACRPTWAEPGAGARAGLVYVACNRDGGVLEVDPAAGLVTRRFATGAGPYNLEATPDGRLLLATLKAEQAVAVFDLETGRELSRIPTTRPLPHGVVASGDARYAFVSNEAVGGTPGTVDVIDLAALARVASIELRLQPGGIDVLR